MPIQERKIRSKASREKQFRVSDYALERFEIERIIESAKNLKEKVILTLLADTSIRRQELLDVRCEHIDFEKRRLLIPCGKRSKERHVPLSGRCIVALRLYIQGRREGLMIRSNHRYRMSRSNLNALVARIAKRAGVLCPCPSRKHVSPHLFRHSFSRIALNEGMPVNELSAILGHKKISMTLDIYSRPSINQVQRSYERIFNEKGKDLDEETVREVVEKVVQAIQRKREGIH